MEKEQWKSRTMYEDDMIIAVALLRMLLGVCVLVTILMGYLLFEERKMARAREERRRRIRHDGSVWEDEKDI